MVNLAYFFTVDGAQARGVRPCPLLEDAENAVPRLFPLIFDCFVFEATSQMMAPAPP